MFQTVLFTGKFSN